MGNVGEFLGGKACYRLNCLRGLPSGKELLPPFRGGRREGLLGGEAFLPHTQMGEIAILQVSMG